MKKIVTLILCSLCGVTALAGCGNSANNNSNTIAETSKIEETTEKKEMSQYEAKNILIEYIENNQSSFERNIKGIYSFDLEHLEVATVKCTNNYADEPPYGFEIKGNFYRMDDYGRVSSHCNYTMHATVDSEGKVDLSYAEIKDW